MCIWFLLVLCLNILTNNKKTICIEEVEFYCGTEATKMWEGK